MRFSGKAAAAVERMRSPHAHCPQNGVFACDCARTTTGKLNRPAGCTALDGGVGALKYTSFGSLGGMCVNYI